MTVAEMMAHARSVRARLQRPPNAWREPQPVLRLEPIRSPGQMLSITTHYVAEQFDVYYRDIIGECRAEPIVTARHLVCYIGANYLGLTLAAIGKFLHRDHTSVMHARNRLEALIASGGSNVERINKIIEVFFDLYYPAFAISNIRQSHLAIRQGKGVSQHGISGMDCGSPRLLAPAKIQAGNQDDQGGILPIHQGGEAGQEAPGYWQSRKGSERFAAKRGDR